MKKARMLKLAEFLDTLPKSRFNMGGWFNLPDGLGIVCETEALKPGCRTTCCVAGWAVLRSGKCLSEEDEVVDQKRYQRISDVPSYAQRYLGLSDRQAQMLFHDHHWPEVVLLRIQDKGRLATPKDAAKVIRWMVANEKTID